MDVNKKNCRYALNIIWVICWTCLAIVFNNSWFALFILLFTPVNSYYRTCDKCGKHSEIALSYNGAIDKAKASGWIIRKVGDKWDDRCPDCQKD